MQEINGNNQELLGIFQRERDSLLMLVKNLCEKQDMGEIFFNDFVYRFNRLVDLGRALVITPEEIMKFQKKEKNNLENKDGVDLNALD